MWRKKHPFGFYARPTRNSDGTRNLLLWDCGIPGKSKTLWHGAVFPLKMLFNIQYPSVPPACSFPKGFFHPNVYPSGKVCLSILDSNWKPSLTVKQILIGIQKLLDQPNPKSPAQRDAITLYLNDRKKYCETVLNQSKLYYKNYKLNIQSITNTTVCKKQIDLNSGDSVKSK